MTRSLPSRPSLESDRKRGKSLKRAHAAGDADAIERIRSHHPRYRSSSPAALRDAPLRLADAQLVVAREYGVESWPRWVALAGFLSADFEARLALLLERCADPEIENAFQGTAVGALFWASTHPDSVETFAPGRSEAQRQQDLVACLDILVRAGAQLRADRLEGASETVAEALRGHGVLDA